MENIYEIIGEKIKELRQIYGGISQEDLAKELKITSNTVSRWEKAVYKPSIIDLQKIANFFGVPISVFFPAVENERLQALMSATGSLDEEDFEELTKYAQFRRGRRLLSKKQNSNKDE